MENTISRSAGRIALDADKSAVRNTGRSTIKHVEIDLAVARGAFAACVGGDGRGARTCGICSRRRQPRQGLRLLALRR